MDRDDEERTEPDDDLTPEERREISLWAIGQQRKALSGGTVATQVSKTEPFPLDVLPTAIRGYVKEAADSLPCPPDFVAVAAVVTAGAMIGTRRVIRLKEGWEEYPLLWALVVGDPGAKKSPGLNKARVPADRYNEILIARTRESIAKYSRDKEAAKVAKQLFAEPEPRKSQFVTGSFTKESLVEILENNPHGCLLAADEATSFISGLNEYKGGKGSDKQFFLSAWACSPYTENRKGVPVKLVQRPFLSITGNVPPDMLGEFADRKNREDGFVDRLLFSYPDPVPVRWNSKGVKSATTEGYCSALLALTKMTGDAVPIELERVARALFGYWINRHNRESEGGAVPKGSWAKFDGYCARLALILHFLWEPDAEKIGLDTIKRAIALIDYFKSHCRRVRGVMAAKQEEQRNDLGRVIGLILSLPERAVKPRDLQQAHIFKTADKALECLKKLASLGMGEMIQGNRKDQWTFKGNNNLKLANGIKEQEESA